MRSRPGKSFRSAASCAGLLLGLACTKPATVPQTPTPVPERPTVFIPPADSSPGPTVVPPPQLRQPVAPAAIALARGWMPLTATGVEAFRGSHPTWDGRGVLIGIMDSGMDAGIVGLDSTTTHRPKILDLRNFSNEGPIVLAPARATGDTLFVGGRVLAGAGRVRAVSSGTIYAGMLRERLLGEPPASDVNDNGVDGDTLAVVVVRASDGWVLFADTDGDGSLANERPVHDFLVARETFGWHHAGEPPPLTIAVNLSEENGAPRLSLFFDTSAHGSHVSGIAAGHNIGGVRDFDGVAPGAQLLGLKIARNDFGGITTTGSVLRAMDYAIKFAAARNLPLVLNMSFGVGNEREGAARLDAAVDSVLAAHPEVVFVTSAGNDGPGLSTMGFPGSAARVITVGATEPWVLSAGAATGGRPAPDVLLYFSSRGGESGKPDMVAPGIAYSTVPRWNMGDEFKGGTSMASPHVAGLAALLVGAAAEQHRAVTAGDIRRALEGSAAPVNGETAVDVGAGVPNVEAAWSILKGPAPAAEFVASAAYKLGGPADSLVRFVVTRTRGTDPVEVTLTSNASWVRAPARLLLRGPVDTVALVQHPPVLPGLHVAVIRASVPGVGGPLFSLITTSVAPDVLGARPLRAEKSLPAGFARRAFFEVDSGRPFRVRISTASLKEHLVAALHLPGGQPSSNENGIPGSADTAAAVYDVDGRDAVAGIWEAVAVATNERGVNATIQVDHSPVRLLGVTGAGDSLRGTLTSTSDSAVVGRLDVGIIGGETSFALGGSGSDDVSKPLTLPSWVRKVTVDLDLGATAWPRFTDFGFTLLGQDGRILGKTPANYARTRLTAELPARMTDQEARIVLSPAFTDPGSMEQWSGKLSVRFEAARPVAVLTNSDEFKLAPKGSAALRGRIVDLPWKLPAGYVPLGLFIAESGGISWSWQLPVTGALKP